MDDEGRLTNLAEAFAALGDPNRLKILELLRSSAHPICVKGLACRLGISQPAVSQHLKVLKLNRLVTDRKEGYYKHYAINGERFDELRKMRKNLFGSELNL